MKWRLNSCFQVFVAPCNIKMNFFYPLFYYYRIYLVINCPIILSSTQRLENLLCTILHINTCYHEITVNYFWSHIFFHYTGARKKDSCIFPAEWWNEINFELLLQSKTFIECFLSNVLWRNKWMEEEIAEGKGKLTGFWWVAAMQSSLLCPLPVIFHDNCCQIPANTIKPPLIFSPKNLGRKKRLVIYTHIK